MAEISHDFAKLSDVTLHYAEAGSRGDDLVLCLHGFPEFWYCWKEQLQALGGHYHVVAPDMRGYNLSDKPEGLKNYNISFLINDICQLIKFLDYKKIWLVAHDWGAAVAWSVAIARPDLLHGLVILNGPHTYIFADLLQTNQTQIDHSQYMKMFRQDGIEEKLIADNFNWLWDFTFAWHLKKGLMTEADKDAYLTAWGQDGAITAMLNYYRASALVPADIAGKNVLGLDPGQFKIHVPTHVVWGMKDHALIPENLVGLDKFVADLSIKRLPDVTHWVTHEAPEIVVSEIDGFIQSIKGRNADD
jgi:epoxide hydrolase 4